MDFILFCGQKRNGNHLAINWLLSHYNNPKFYNDVHPSEATFDSAVVHKILNNISLDKNDCVILSIENLQTLRKEILDLMIKTIKKKFAPRKVFNPFILRDPFNWYASELMKISKLSNIELDKYALKKNKEIWNKYTSAMNFWLAAGFKINYNQFVVNTAYRQQISKTIERPFTIKDNIIMNTLWEPAGVKIASSFDAESVKSGLLQPRDMQVFKRYKQFIHILKKINIPPQVNEVASKFWPEININDISLI